MKEKKPLIIILGPTAAGKTALSIELAARLNGEIISADSRLFYRGMDIGTAKPSLEERSRVPHYLIDVDEPDRTWSLGQYKEAAHAIIHGLHERGVLPFLVGGTGQYVRTMLEEWTVPAVPPDLEMRQILEAWGEAIGAEGLYRRLEYLDPAAAANIDARNVRRTVRALEVIFKSGRTFSSQRSRVEARYRNIVVGVNYPRELLYQRIDQRIENMLAAGFVEEVRELLKRGYDSDLPSFSAIGYREIAAYVKGEMTLDEAVVLIKRQTRVYVRRQANWFKPADPQIRWFDMSASTFEEIEAYVISALKGKSV